MCPVSECPVFESPRYLDCADISMPLSVYHFTRYFAKLGHTSKKYLTFFVANIVTSQQLVFLDFKFFAYYLIHTTLFSYPQ